MRFLSLFILILIASLSSAVTLQVLDPCTGAVKHHSQSVLTGVLPSVGEFTATQFRQLGVPFEGSNMAIFSIFNTPTGDDSVEVFGPSHLYAYGWCYHINGVEPGKMAGEVFLQGNQDHILWFFSYTEFRDGEWLTMCEPSHLRPLKSYCGR